MSITLFAQLVADGVRPREAATTTEQRVAAEELMQRDDVKAEIQKHKEKRRALDLKAARSRPHVTRAQFADTLLTTLEQAQTRRDTKTALQCIKLLGQLIGLREDVTSDPITVKMDWSIRGARQAKRLAG